MIAKEPDDNGDATDCIWHQRMDRLFGEAVNNAMDDSRRKGVPIPHRVNGITRYELPDGTMVDEDPWHGEKTAPEGWYERFGIQPPAAQ